MNDSMTKTHSIAAIVTGAALLASAIVPGHDVALVWFVATLPLLASLAAFALQGGKLSNHLLAVLALELTVLIAVPRLYTHARCQSDAARVVELAQQSRIGEARSLAHQVLALSPNATWKGNSLKLAADNLDRMAQQIEERVGLPLPQKALFEDQLNRGRDLAMLGRATKALEILDEVPASDGLPEACNLRGAIHESQDQWRSAREWYDRARDSWMPREKSDQRTAGLVQAVTGIAFSERKL